MMIVGGVAVVGIQKRDAVDAVFDRVGAVDVAEDEAPAAGVGGEGDGGFGGNLGGDVIDDPADELRVVGVLRAPGGPGFSVGFQAREDDVSRWIDLAEAARLCGDVLDVEVPIEAWGHLAAEGLLDGVAVGEGVEDEERWLVCVEVCRGVGDDADAGISRFFVGLFVEKVGRCETASGGEDRQDQRERGARKLHALYCTTGMRVSSREMRCRVACVIICGFLGACSAPREARLLDNPDASGKIPAIKMAVERKDYAATKQLVKDLDSDDAAVRLYAIEGLKRLTGETFGYEYYFDEDERRPAIERWQRWLDGQNASAEAGK
jgi:hypothetical protein